MEDSPKGTGHHPEDDQLMGIEALSQHARVSPAFIRLCIEKGCPAPANKLSQSGMIEWLALHYEEVRAVAGLRALAPVEGVRASARRALQLSNTMLTLLEYAESRSTRLEEKARLRALQVLVERAI